MKFSDSILKGCELVPTQVKGTLFLYASSLGTNVEEQLVGSRDMVSAACVLGASYIGVVGLFSFADATANVGAALVAAFPMLADPAAEWNLPGEYDPDTNIETWCVSMNDDEHKSREEIAAMLKEAGL